MLSAAVAHQREGKSRTHRLCKRSIVGDPRLASGIGADVSSLRYAVREVVFLEENNKLLGGIVYVLTPVSCEESVVRAAVEPSEFVILPCLGVVGLSLTFDYLAIWRHVVHILDLVD